MVNIRENPVPYHGLEVSLQYDEERSETINTKGITKFDLKEEGRGFFLTGERPGFKLKVYNPGDKKRTGMMYIVWNTRNLESTIRTVAIDIEPEGTAIYPIKKDWVGAPELCSYRLASQGEPEEIQERLVNSRYASVPSEFQPGDISDEVELLMDLKREINESAFDNLCSYSVRDKAVFEHEEKMRKSRSTHQRWMQWLTVAILVLTLIYVGTFIYSLIAGM